MPRAKPQPAPALPDTLYVVRRKDEGTEFFVADEQIDDFEDGEVVGVYHRAKVVTKHVRHTVE